MRIIAVIAEDKGVCESLRAALPETDFVIIESTVEAAARRFITIQPDVVILDDTPRLGLTAIRQLKELSPQLAIVVLTARGDDETKAAYILAGARTCLTKPFNYDELQHVLAEFEPPDHSPRETGAVFTGARTPSTALAQHQAALRWISRTASHIRDPYRLSQSLTEALVDIFDAVRSIVLLKNGGYAHIISEHGIPPSIRDSLKLSVTSGMMRWFEENMCLVDRDDQRTTPAALREMQVLGIRLGVPLMGSGRVRGAILIGEKASGMEYSVEERELLTAFTRCASITMDNASLYEDITTERERLDTLLANITAGVAVVDKHRNVTMMNPSAESILQVRAVDVIGRSVQKLGSEFADVTLRVLESGKALLRQEIRDAAIKAKLGLSVTPLGSDGAVAVFTRLPEDAGPKQDDVSYSPFWEYLASRVAQEIKNPMVAVNTFAQLLPKKYDSEDFRETFSEVVHGEIARINNVVELLFEFARRPRLVFQRADLNDTITKALQTFEEELLARDIKLRLEASQGTPEVELDPVFFTQAFHNVVQNAIDAMPEGGELRARIGRHDGYCEVAVMDTGSGVPEKDLDRVFLPFFSTKEKGIGLGLAMARRIMQQHEGEIRIINNEEGGGAFALRLPPADRVHANNTSS